MVTKSDVATSETTVDTDVQSMEEIESGPNRRDFEELKPALMAIADSDVEEPDYPVSFIAQFGDDTVSQATQDREVLEAHGLDWDLVQSVAKRVGALHYADATMQATRHLQSPYRVTFTELEAEGHEVCDYIVHGLRYALADQPRPLRGVRRIAEGASQHDLIHDLSVAARTGKMHSAELTGIGFDLSKLDRAAQLSDQLGKARGEMNTVRGETTAKNMRDRAYTYLKQGLDKIRACGRYAFWKDPVKAARYAIDYPSYSRRQKVEEEEVAVEATQS